MTNKRALNVFSYTATMESLHYLCICSGDFETEQVLLEYRGELWFLLVLWTSCNVLFNTSLRDHSGGIYLCMNVSGDVCGEVVSHSLMPKPAAFLSKLMSVKMNKHLCGLNAIVFFLTCCLEANPSCVPLGEMLDIGALDPAKLPQRVSKNDDVDLVSRSHEADDGVWVGHNEALDRTMSAMGKILLDPANGKAFSHIDGQSDRVDVANEVSLQKVNVSAVPLLKTRNLQLESIFQTFRRQSCVKECAPEVFEIECRGQRASADISCVLPCLERLKRSSLRWLPKECHVVFRTLIVILIQSKRTPTHSGSRRPPSGKF